MLLSMHPDYVMVHQLWPQSPERTLIVCDWFFHPDAFGRPDFNPDDAIEFWDMTNRQDWHVCELSQQGIASRAYRAGSLFSARKHPGRVGPRISARDVLTHTSKRGRASGSGCGSLQFRQDLFRDRFLLLKSGLRWHAMDADRQEHFSL